MRYLYTFLFVFIIAFGAKAQPEIGGYSTPLQYSIHTYTVTMGGATNNVEWDIYLPGVTRPEIDDGTALPLVKGSAYYVVSKTETAGIASFTVDFRGTMPTGEYLLAYREESADNCWDFQFLSFELFDPFDIDLDPANTINNTDCPDTHMEYLEGTGTPDIPTTQTVIEYPVNMTYPGDDPYYITSSDPIGNWSFYFEVTVNGQGGSDALINEISYDGFSVNPAASTYTNLVTVPNNVREFIITVTYDDVAGITQEIDFELTQIEGTYGERDVDVILGNTGENEMTHTINAIPAASYIVALD
jgi:hypothetical protein